jgi:hypothetical protein
LLRLAGLEIADKKDRSKIETVLQGVPSQDVPLSLADAIIAKHKLSYDTRFELANRIIGAMELTDPIGTIRKEFLTKKPSKPGDDEIK